MIHRLLTIGRWLNFALAASILLVILWGFLAGTQKIETPMFAVWLFLGVAVARLLVWTTGKAARGL